MCGQVFVYIQSVQAYLSPPIFVAYFAGILWRRANERGALACLGLGYGLGFSRLALEIAFKDWCASGDADGFFGLYICVPTREGGWPSSSEPQPQCWSWSRMLGPS